MEENQGRLPVAGNHVTIEEVEAPWLGFFVVIILVYK